MLEDIAERIVNAQTKKPYLFILGFLVLGLLIAPGILRLVGNVEPSLEKVLPQDIEEVKTMNDMRTQFGADMMYLLVYAEGPVTDVRQPEFLSYIDLLAQKIRTRDHIREVTTLADQVRSANNGVIPDSFLQTKESLRPNPLVSQYANEDYSFSVIRIRSDTGASAATIKQVVGDIETDIASLESLNPGARTEITGFNAIDKATFEVIMSDFAFITLVSMALVGVVVFITFKSFLKGMLPMVVVMNALLWTMGITGYLGLTITVVSMVAAAMIMGLGIDFGIHVVHSYFELRKTKKPTIALKETMRELLRAMMGASFTTISGFLALLFGVLPAMKTLGIILAIGIFTTLIGAVFLLPVVVYLYDGGAKAIPN
jgi:predicted RND superfamily exporter protein